MQYNLFSLLFSSLPLAILLLFTNFFASSTLENQTAFVISNVVLSNFNVSLDHPTSKR